MTYISTPINYTLDQACKLLGLGRTRLYQEMNAGRLRALKSGRRTLLSHSDIQEWLSQLAPYKPRNGIQEGSRDA